MTNEEWAKLLAGPLVEKWREWSLGNKGTESAKFAVGHCADELLAHLRESGIVELIEAGQAMRDAGKVPVNFVAELGEAQRKWDAAKLLGKETK